MSVIRDRIPPVEVPAVARIGSYRNGDREFSSACGLQVGIGRNDFADSQGYKPKAAAIFVVNNAGVVKRVDVAVEVLGRTGRLLRRREIKMRVDVINHWREKIAREECSGAGQIADRRSWPNVSTAVDNGRRRTLDGQEEAVMLVEIRKVLIRSNHQRVWSGGDLWIAGADALVPGPGCARRRRIRKYMRMRRRSSRTICRHWTIGARPVHVIVVVALASAIDSLQKRSWLLGSRRSTGRRVVERSMNNQLL